MVSDLSRRELALAWARDVGAPGESMLAMSDRILSEVDDALIEIPHHNDEEAP